MTLLQDNGTVLEEGRGIFGTKSVGSVFYGQFECSNCNHSGILLMGNKALCFFGKLFALERRLVMCYDDIVSVERFKRNGIKIVMKPVTGSALAGGSQTIAGKGEDHIFYFSDQSFRSAVQGATAQQTNICSTAAIEDMDDVLNLLSDLCERYSAGFLLEDDEGACANAESSVTSIVFPSLSSRSMVSLRPSVKSLPYPLNRKIPTENSQRNEEKSTAVDNHEILLPESVEDASLIHARSPSQALAAVAAMADFRSFSMALKDQRQLNALVKITQESEKEEDNVIVDGDEKVQEVETGYDSECEPKNLKTAWDELKQATPVIYKESALCVSLRHLFVSLRPTFFEMFFVKPLIFFRFVIHEGCQA
jgi:hypothetical protein